MGRLVVFAAIASSFVWAFWYQHEDIGSFTEIKDGVTHVSAATSPQAVLMSLLGLVVYCVLLNTHVMEQNFRIASMWKRAAAFVVDFWFAVFTLGALFGFIDILLEASRTGVFRWHFQRDYLVSSDGVSLVLVFVGLATAAPGTAHVGTDAFVRPSAPQVSGRSAAPPKPAPTAAATATTRKPAASVKASVPLTGKTEAPKERKTSAHGASRG